MVFHKRQGSYDSGCQGSEPSDAEVFVWRPIMGDGSTMLRKLSPLALHIHFDDAFFDEENQVRKKTKKKT